MTNIANWKDPPSLIVQSVQSTISMGHFSVRYVKLPEGKFFLSNNIKINKPLGLI